MSSPAYLLWVGGSLLLSFGLFFAGSRACRKTALAALIPSVILGAVCSKLLYMLLQLDFVLADDWKSLLFSTSPEHFSFVGGIVGVCLAVVLCARLTQVRPVEALNAFAPAGLVLAALLRFAEGFLAGDYMTGTGPWMEEGSALCFFPLSINISPDPEWQEWYLSVFLLEGLFLLAAALISAMCFKKGRFIRSLFLMCLPQIIFENLLNNVFWWIFCIRVEQLIYMAVMAVILVIYTIRAKGWKLRLLPVIVAAACVGLFIVLEFAMEQKIEALMFLNVSACYALMGAGVLALCVTEIVSARKVPFRN